MTNKTLSALILSFMLSSSVGAAVICPDGYWAEGTSNSNIMACTNGTVVGPCFIANTGESATCPGAQSASSTSGSKKPLPDPGAGSGNKLKKVR